MESNKLQWWGYKHTSGTYQAKRYFGKQDIDEAYESPFCEIVVGPFEAEGREEALKIIMNDCTEYEILKNKTKQNE